MVSSYYRGFAVTALAVGLYIKLFFLAAVFSRVTLDELDKAIGAYAVLHIGGGVANILAPGFFLDLVGAVASSADRFMGLQLNPNSFAFASALLTIYYIYVRRNMFAAVFLGITVVASGSRSGLAFLALAILYFAYLQGRIKGQVLRKAIVAAAIIGAAFVSALFFFPDQFLRSLDSAIATADGFGFYPRVALLIGGIQLAVANFPLGAGAGTYASALAGFSQTYRDVGVDYLPSILDESAIHDSGVGTLLGEYGVAGTLAILVFCYRLALIFGRGYITRVDGLFFVFLVIFFSLFRATISSYYYSGILIVFLMMVYAVRSRAGR